MTTAPKPRADPRLRLLPQPNFAIRWLQLPPHLGLIVAQGVYVWRFRVGLVHRVQATIGGDSSAAQAVIASITPPGATPEYDSHWRTP